MAAPTRPPPTTATSKSSRRAAVLIIRPSATDQGTACSPTESEPQGEWKRQTNFRERRAIEESFHNERSCLIEIESESVVIPAGAEHLISAMPNRHGHRAKRTMVSSAMAFSFQRNHLTGLKE